MAFKYKYEHLNCEYCHKPKCSRRLCRHIIENIGDLVCDNKFLRAVANAEKSRTRHRRTLIYVKNNMEALMKKDDFSGKNKGAESPFHESNSETCDFKPECKTCRYASPGFVCYNTHDKTCLKDWVKSMQKGGGGHAGKC